MNPPDFTTEAKEILSILNKSCDNEDKVKYLAIGLEMAFLNGCVETTRASMSKDGERE